MEGATLRTVRGAAFAEHQALRGYLVDDQADLRKHVVIFVDGVRVYAVRFAG